MPSNIHVKRNAKPRKMKTVRVDSIEIKNLDDNLYYAIKCKKQNGVAVLFLSDAGSN